MVLWILVGASIVAIIAALAIAVCWEGKEGKEGDKRCESPNRCNPNYDEEAGIGAPLFSNISGRKPLVRALDVGETVVALTPMGPQIFKVTYIASSELAMLNNSDYTAEAYFDVYYFSPSVAARLNRSRGAWRLSKMSRKATGMQVGYDDSARWANRRWLEDEAIFGIDDWFDTLLFYNLMFDTGFSEPLSHYQEMEGEWDVPPVEIAEPLDAGEPSQPYEPPEPTVEEVPEISEEPSAETIVAETPASEPPPSVPEPPTPDPEPSSSGYSSGSGWDSGSSDSGSDWSSSSDSGGYSGGSDSGGSDWD
jgi:uncharacterized membrane protein YgcG